MNILWVSHFLLYPQTGYGALQRSRNLLLGLAKEHHVYLVSYYRDIDLDFVSSLETAQDDLEGRCEQVKLIPHNWGNKFIRGIRAAKALFSQCPYSVSMYHSSFMQDEIIEIANRNKIDLIHSDTIGLIDKSLEKIGSKTIKVLNHHNIESEMMLRRMRKVRNPLMKAFLLNEGLKLRRYERHFCRKYDLNIVVSELDGQRLKKTCGNAKISVIENGVDCSYFQPHLRDCNNKGIIFTGSLDWYPNTDSMIYFCRDIWPHLRNRDRNLTLTIIGKNPPKDLLNIIERSPGIHLKGYVPDVRPYIKEARLFICPIRDGGGTKLKILDALAQGIPVISTKTGCEGLNVTDGENILIADNAEDFVKKITLLQGSVEICNRLSRNGRILVEKEYSFNFLGKKLSELYSGLAYSHRC